MYIGDTGVMGKSDMAVSFEDNIKKQKCFLCERSAMLLFVDDGYRVQCENCGSFHLSRTMLATMKDNELELLPYLSIYTRQASDRGENVLLNSENWRKIALACKEIPFPVKVHKLLKLAAERSQPGHPAEFDPDSDPPLVDAADRREFQFLFRHLQENNYDWTITLKGKAWEELQAVKTPEPVNTQRSSGFYVDPSRIEDLKSLKHPSFDFSKLIRMCDELNTCYAEECYLAVAMLVRSVLDHVPPIFGCKNFVEVANNYAGAKSFKDSMKNLESSSRKIADSHLHGQIRKSESLPNRTQVNFANDMDVLLAEIVRTLK